MRVGVLAEREVIRGSKPPGVSAGSGPSLLAGCQTHSDRSPVAGIVIHRMMGRASVFQWVVHHRWDDLSGQSTSLLFNHLRLDDNYPNACLVFGELRIFRAEGSLEKIVNVETVHDFTRLHECLTIKCFLGG